MRVNGTLYYTLKDHLGSASVVTDSTGNIVGEQRYYPFGETRLATGTLYTDKLFTGQRNIAGLGIYHYQSRFYSPKLGRFLSADSLVPNPANPQDLNRFSYVRNNPIRYIDPTGHAVANENDSGCFKSNCGRPTSPPTCPPNCSDPPNHRDDEDNQPQTVIGPTDGPQESDNEQSNDPFFEVEFWLTGYDWLQLLDESSTWVDNYGRPFYRHAKGVVPGGFWLEFGLGALTTFVGDLNNPEFTWGQTIARAGVVGFEDGVVEALSTRGATFVAGGAGLGTLETGPGAAIAAGVAFFATSVFINEAGNAVAGTLNHIFMPSYFP